MGALGYVMQSDRREGRNYLQRTEGDELEAMIVECSVEERQRRSYSAM